MNLAAVAIAAPFWAVLLRTNGHDLKVSCFAARPDSAARSGHAQAPDGHEQE